MRRDILISTRPLGTAVAAPVAVHAYVGVSPNRGCPR